MPSFAYYRLPGKRSYVRLFREGAVGTLPSVEEADGRAGFLIAPFAPNEATPIVLLEPEEVREGCGRGSAIRWCWRARPQCPFLLFLTKH